MFFYSLSEDEYVIEVDHYYTFHDEVLEDIVHYCLESGWTVSHTKEYYKGFEQTPVGVEGSLPLISGLNIYIVETLVDVKLGKVFGSMEL